MKLSTNDNNLMYNCYAYKQNKQFLSEAEQAQVQQQQVKQKFEQELQSPEAQQAMLKQAQEIFNNPQYKERIQQALAKDGGKAGAAVDALLKQIQDELSKQAAQQVKESLDLQEGFFGRTASLASGAMKKAGDYMSGKPQSGLGFRQEAILKHFEKLKSSLGSQLKELQRDMETTSGTDTKVKDLVNKTVAEVESAHGIAPTSSKFQDFRHKAGKFVQNVATGAVLAAPVVALAAPLAAAAGLTGAAAAAVSAGLTGGSVSMLKDLINGQKPDAKRAAITGIASAATAGLFKAGMDHFSGQEIPAGGEVADAGDQSFVADPHAANTETEIVDFNQNHGTPFDANSSMDASKVDMGASLKDTGLSGYGSTFGAKTIMRNLTDEFSNHAKQLGIPQDQLKDVINNTLKNLSPEQLETLSDDKALRTGKAALDFAKILADQNPNLAKRGIERIARAFVDKWQ